MQRRRRGGSTTTPTSDPMRSHVRRASEGEDGAPLLPASDAVAPLEMEAGSYRHQSGLQQPPAGAAGADDGGAAGGSKAPRHQPLRLAGGLEVQPELLAIVLGEGADSQLAFSCGSPTLQSMLSPLPAPLLSQHAINLMPANRSR